MDFGLRIDYKRTLICLATLPWGVAAVTFFATVDTYHWVKTDTAFTELVKKKFVSFVKFVSKKASHLRIVKFWEWP